MKKSSISLLIGICAIIFTIIMYFVFIGNIFLEIICFITLLGVVIAEIITTLFAYLSKGNPRKVAAAIVSALSIPYSVALSIVYIIGFPTAYGKYIGLYFAGLIVVIAIAIILFRFDSNKSIENEEIQANKNNILMMRKVVKCILAKPEAANYKKELENMEEKLHFTNDAVQMPEDGKIYEMLVALQNGISTPEYETAQAIANLSALIDTRNVMSKNGI